LQHSSQYSLQQSSQHSLQHSSQHSSQQFSQQQIEKILLLAFLFLIHSYQSLIQPTKNIQQRPEVDVLSELCKDYLLKFEFLWDSMNDLKQIVLFLQDQPDVIKTIDKFEKVLINFINFIFFISFLGSSKICLLFGETKTSYG
jgi:hypothetical protein